MPHFVPVGYFWLALLDRRWAQRAGKVKGENFPVQIRGGGNLTPGECETVVASGVDKECICSCFGDFFSEGEDMRL